MKLIENFSEFEKEYEKLNEGKSTDPILNSLYENEMHVHDLKEPQFQNLLSLYNFKKDGDNYHLGNPENGVELFVSRNEESYTLKGKGPLADKVVKGLGLEENLDEGIIDFFKGIVDKIKNGMRKILPGKGMKVADDILARYEGLYRDKVTEELEIMKQISKARLKWTQAKKQGSSNADSLENSFRKLREILNKKQDANSRKWLALEEKLDREVEEFRKEYKESDKIMSYIEMKLSEIRVNIYTEMEQTYEKFATEEEVEGFAKELEDEKKKVEELSKTLSEYAKEAVGGTKIEDLAKGQKWERAAKDGSTQTVEVIGEPGEKEVQVRNRKTGATYSVAIDSMKKHLK